SGVGLNQYVYGGLPGCCTMASGSVMVSLGMTNTVSRSSVRSSRLETVMRAGASWCCASAYTTVAPRRRPTLLPVTLSIVATGLGPPPTESRVMCHLTTAGLWGLALAG